MVWPNFIHVYPEESVKTQSLIPLAILLLRYFSLKNGTLCCQGKGHLCRKCMVQTFQQNEEGDEKNLPRKANSQWKVPPWWGRPEKWNKPQKFLPLLCVSNILQFGKEECKLSCAIQRDNLVGFSDYYSLMYFLSVFHFRSRINKSYSSPVHTDNTLYEE